MILTALALTLTAQGTPNQISSFERAAGWELAFDGATTDGWHSLGEEGVREGGWEVTDGCLHLPAGAGGGDLVTGRDYADFELEFEWRVAPGANSGVKYRVPVGADTRSMLGPEYQVLDDAAHPDGARGVHSAGSLYALFAPAEKELAPVGEFNRARIVAHGGRIEHWLNGRLLVVANVGDTQWEARRTASKFKSHDEFARGRGRIGLQDHGDEVWFRSIRIRDLKNLPGEPVELFDGATLAGWREVGDALWSVDEGSILGEIGGGGQSFLVSERSFGDFLLEVELKPELPGNSGIQIRSHQRPNGRVFGYQIEIDSSERAWSGGLYDEARRAWLDDLEDEPAARAAFRTGEWNHYRIECIGPWIRTWVNGVPAADWLDPIDLEGFFALQVHSGSNTRMRWRNLSLRDLGTRSWRAMTWAELMASSGARSEERAPTWSDLGLRFDLPREFARAGAERCMIALRAHSALELPPADQLGTIQRLDGGGWGVLMPSAGFADIEAGDDPLEVSVLVRGERCFVFAGGRLVASDTWPDAAPRGRVRVERPASADPFANLRVLGEPD